jgi:hypothetical protein
MDIFIHLANVIYVISYLVRDILWLRCLTVIAGATLLPYFYLNGLWPPIIWGFVFIAVNAWQIRALLMERRPVQLSETEQHLYQMTFRALKPREFLKLLSIATWKKAEPKDHLVKSGLELDQMMVVYEGKLEVEVGGQSVACLDDGCFVGEISFLTGGTPNADVVAVEATSYVSWPSKQLQEFLASNPELRASWQFLIGSDLAAKLRAA